MNHFHWRCNGETVQGASHKRTSSQNQDAIQCESVTLQSGQMLLMAISDGHGGQAYFRSHIGAKCAVQVTAKLVKAFAQSWLGRSPNSTFDRAVHQLPQQIVEQWRKSVAAHLQQHPITPFEWKQINAEEPWRGAERSSIEQDPAIVYGATLLLVMVTPTVALYFQIGDGDILCVNHDGETQYPLPKDDRLVANQTVSLCTPQAWNEGRLRLIRYDDATRPALILAATDGYANSYATDADFLKIGADYLRSIRQETFDRVIVQLPEILNETSRRGSGDDVTLGMIYLESAQPATVIQSEIIPPTKIGHTPIVAMPVQPPKSMPGREASRKQAAHEDVLASTPAVTPQTQLLPTGAQRRSRSRFWLWISPVLLLLGAGVGFAWFQVMAMKPSETAQPAANPTPTQPSPSEAPSDRSSPRPKPSTKKSPSGMKPQKPMPDYDLPN